MPTVSRTFSVDPPPARVIEYLRDFANAEEWDPGTQSCTRQDDGPLAEGAAWHNVSKIFGVTARLTYVLQTSTERMLVFVGRNKSSTSTDRITVEASASGSVVSYRADLEMHGLAKLLNPVMKVAFEKLANDTRSRMTSVLNGLSATGETYPRD